MGYQEAFKPISHLAEAAGIREAVEEYKDCPDVPGYCTFYCATKSNAFDENGNPRLYACVGGDRHVSMHIGRYSFDPPLDWVYNDHFAHALKPRGASRSSSRKPTDGVQNSTANAKSFARR